MLQPLELQRKGTAAVLERAVTEPVLAGGKGLGIAGHFAFQCVFVFSESLLLPVQSFPTPLLPLSAASASSQLLFRRACRDLQLFWGWLMQLCC